MNHFIQNTPVTWSKRGKYRAYVQDTSGSSFTQVVIGWKTGVKFSSESLSVVIPIALLLSAVI